MEAVPDVAETALLVATIENMASTSPSDGTGPSLPPRVFFLFYNEIAFAISLAITAWPNDSPPSLAGTR